MDEAGELLDGNDVIPLLVMQLSIAMFLPEAKRTNVTFISMQWKVWKKSLKN